MRVNAKTILTLLAAGCFVGVAIAAGLALVWHGHAWLHTDDRRAGNGAPVDGRGVLLDC